MVTTASALSTATVKQIDDFSKPYFLMKPLETPTATLLQLVEGPAPKSKKIQLGEEDVLPVTTSINFAAGYNDAATSFVFDSTAGMQQGGYFRVKRTGEWIQIGDVNVDGVTIGGVTPCTRSSLGTTNYALLDNDVVDIKIQSQAEGFAFSSVTPIMVTAEDVYNYCEIWARKLNITNTELKIMGNGGVAYGEDWDNQVKKAIWNIKREVNFAAIYGLRSGTTTRTTGGIKQFASWQSTAVGDITDRATLSNTFANIGKYTSDLMVPCSPIALEAFSYCLQGTNPTNATGQTVVKAGVRIRTIELQSGLTLHLYKEPAMLDYLNAAGAEVGEFACWPKDGFKVHWLRPIGEYSIPPTADATETLCLAEGGFSFEGSKRFGLFGGVTKPT